MSPRNTASQAAGDPPLELGDLDDPAPQGDTAITRSHPPSICTISRLAETVGEVTIRQWARMTAEQRSMYELGQTTVRSSVWKEMGKLGIQDNPIAKGRYLISQYGGRMGILFMRRIR